MADFPLVVPVILCGGEGRRLWPLSRKSLPKQFLPLMNKEKSMLQQTVERFKNARKSSKLAGFSFSAPLLVCNQHHAFVVNQQLAELDDHQADILVEPVRRDSAPGIAAASLVAQEKYGDPILLILPSDAFIHEDEAWENALAAACKAASEDYLTVFGIGPAHPETGYGYIKVGLPIDSLPQTYHLARFVEKPDLEKAKTYVESGKYLWNSGMFISKASLMLKEFQQYQPEILASVQKAVQNRLTGSDFDILEKEAFESSPSLSIDFAIAEHTRQGAVVEASFKWSDIGSWQSLWENSDRDNAGNAINENVFLRHTKKTFIRSEGPVIMANDVENLAIIATSDAVLVTSRAKAQDVKNCVAMLEKEDRAEARDNLTMRRPWGKYTVLIHSRGYMVKEIEVLPGHRLSLQKHFHRSEHWVVVSGTAIVTCGDEVKELKENEGIYIPKEAVHRLENRGTEPLIIIETQCGDPLEESDIVRFEDDYRRK